jgi:integrase
MSAELQNENLKELLSIALKSGILDMNDVKKAMLSKKIEEAVKNHPNRIWQGKNGRWYTHVKDEDSSEGRRLIVKPDRDALAIAIYEHSEKIDVKKRYQKMTLRQLYPKWLEYKKLHTNAVTYISRIQSDWNRFYEKSAISDIPIVKLTRLNLDEWVHATIQEHSLTKVQYYNMSVIMRQALLYAVELGILTDSPFDKVKPDARRMFRKVRKKPDNTQVFTDTERKAITELAWSDFNNHVQIYELAPLALLFQFQTGLRIGELCTVRYSDIETTDYIHIQRMWQRDTYKVVDHTKTENGDRQVFLTEAAKNLIRTAKERQHEDKVSDSGYIFSVTDKPIPERVIGNLYRKYCKKAGIMTKSSHKARKTYISALIDSGCNLNTIRELVGHADERTTLGNYCFDRHTDEQKKALIEQALKL